MPEGLFAIRMQHDATQAGGDEMPQLPLHLQWSPPLQPSGSGLELPGRVKGGLVQEGWRMETRVSEGSLPVLYLFCG